MYAIPKATIQDTTFVPFGFRSTPELSGFLLPRRALLVVAQVGRASLELLRGGVFFFGGLMGEGWIKLHRKLFDWQWFKSDKHLRLFLTLLLEASHQQTKWRNETLQPGQVLSGRRRLAARSGLSEQSVRTILYDLLSTNEITIKSTNKYSVITIVKWEDYQIGGSKSTSKSTSQLTINQPTTNHIQEGIKNLKNINTSLGHQSLEQLNLTLKDQNFIQLMEQTYGENCSVEREFQKMKAWVMANPAKASKRKQWKRFVNNWLSRIKNEPTETPTTEVPARLRTARRMAIEEKQRRR